MLTFLSVVRGDKADAWLPIVGAARRGNITLLYSARDTKENNAVALKEYVGKRLAVKGRW